MTKIILIDDHPMMRTALRISLEDQADLQVIGEAGSVAEGTKISESLNPDLILLDYYLPDGTSLDVIRFRNENLPNTRILVMSSSDDETNIISALEAGANGYIVKDTPSETFLQAVNGVIQVGLFLTTGATKILLKHMRQNRNLLEEAREGLSNREKEILMIMAKGEANPEIARLLEITESTLRTHYQRIQRKLGLQNHNQMVIFAAKYFSSETEPEQPD